ncbi:MAG: 2-hydroxyacyl-CoA dehydratase subunit D [bacterium]
MNLPVNNNTVPAKKPAAFLSRIKAEWKSLENDGRSFVIDLILNNSSILTRIRPLQTSSGKEISSTTIIWKLTQTMWERPKVFENRIDLSLYGICELIYLTLTVEDRLKQARNKGIPVIGKWPANPTDIYFGLGTVGCDPFFSAFCLMLAQGENSLALKGRASLSEDCCPAQAAAYVALNEEQLHLDYFYPFIGPWCYDSQYCFEALKNKIEGDFGDHPVFSGGRRKKLARSYMKKELERFVWKMSELTGRPYDPEELRKQIELQNKIRKILREIAAFTLCDRPPISSLDLIFCTFVSSDLLGDPLATFQALSRIRNSARKRLIMRQGGYNVQKNPVRLLITGIAPGDLYIYSMIDRLGGIVVGSECVVNLYFEDIKTTGDPLEAMTDRFLSVPYTLKARERADWTLNHFRRLKKADGVIFNCNFGCNYQAAEARIVTDTLKEAGIPCLITDADLPRGNRGQMRTRIEAFIEMLRENSDKL